MISVLKLNNIIELLKYQDSYSGNIVNSVRCSQSKTLHSCFLALITVKEMEYEDQEREKNNNNFLASLTLFQMHLPQCK